MEFRILGPLRALEADREIELGAPKQRAVLAVLLLDAGRVVSTDRIVAAVWGDDAPPSVAASLQAYLSNLRRLLRDGATIERRAPGYVLEAPGASIDRTGFLEAAASARDAADEADWATAATAAEGALRIWTGPLLADLADETWVAEHAVALEERRADVAELLVTALLGCDRTGDAVAEARRLLHREPYRERAAWLLMVALHRAGRSSEALEAFTQHAARLDEELGLEAPPSLRDLQVAILRRAPELDRWPAAVDAAPVPTETPAPPSDLVGRRAELAVVDDLVSGPRRGMRWLVLSGPAGIGKTRLAEETLDLLRRRGVRVVRTACPEDDGTPPWWPVRQLLRATGDVDPDDVLTPPAGTSADAARFGVYAKLESAVETIAEAPTVVLVDDLQWSDASSLRWFRHLAESAPHVPLDVVATVRDGVESEALDGFLAAVARHPAMRQIAVTPLGVDEVGELASRVSGDRLEEQEAAALTAQTAGNPFLVGEYARLPRHERAAGGVPVAVRSVLRRRLATVDVEVLGVLRTAAVAGEELDVELLGAVTRLDRDDLADLLTEAAEQELVVPVAGGSGYRFSHGLLRDEVLAGLSQPRRQRLHARIADALRGTSQHDLVRRAAHLVAALPLADPGEAYRACRAAAEAAVERFQSESAAEWWQQAARAYALLPEQDDEERDDLLLRRVLALGRAGKRQTVLEAVEAALLDAVRNDRIASAGRLAAATLRTSGIWPWTSFTADPGPLLTRLVGVEPLVRADPGAHARVLAALAVGNYYNPDLEVPDRLSLRAIEIAEHVGDADVLADALLGRLLVLSGLSSRAAESLPIADRLAALPHRTSEIDEVLRQDHLTLALMTLGDVVGAEAALREGIAGSDRLRLPIVRVQLRWMEANLALWHGDLERSRRLAEAAEEVHGQTELYIMSVGGLTGLARAWEEGRLEDMEVPLTDQQELPWLRAAMHLAAGRIEDGRKALDRASRAQARDLWTSLGERTVAAQLVAERGLVDWADAMIQQLRPYRAMIGAFGQTGQAGVVALVMARLELLAEAEAVAERGRGVPTLIRCRLLRAQLEGAEPAVFAAIAEDAERIGLRRVAAQAAERQPTDAGAAAG